MKKILLSLSLMGACLYAHAQAMQSNPPNSGSFDVIQNTAKGTEHINVNYTLYPAPFINVVNMFMNTPDPMALTAKMLNENSETVMNWMPSQKSNRYSYQFDISNLPAGNYRLEIYGPDSKKVTTIPFAKQASASSSRSGSGMSR